MSGLPAHLLLLVAEHADFAGIQALRATCKANRTLLDCYERAVTRLNAARYPCAPCKHMLSSDTRERQVLPQDTFETLRELEFRQRTIRDMVDGPYLAFWQEEEETLQDAAKAATIRANLHRALWQCSAIADLETHSIRYRDDVVPRRDPAVKSLINQEITLRDAPPPDGWHLALRDVHESNRRDARFRQIAYVRRLPAQDLAGIAVLAHLTSLGYMRWYRGGPRGSGGGGGGEGVVLPRPETVEMGVCMAENTIRHGVFFLHAKVRSDDDEANRHAKLLLDDTHGEMRRWEAGDPTVLQGLTMNVAATLCARLGCEHRDMLAAACTLLRGDVWRPATSDAAEKEAEPDAERGKPPADVLVGPAGEDPAEDHVDV